MKKNRIVTGAQVHTHQKGNILISNGFIDAYSTIKLQRGHKLIIALLSEGNEMITATVDSLVLVPHKSRLRKFRIYFNDSAILPPPPNHRNYQNFVYL